MQDSVRATFKDERSLEDTIEGLRNGTIKPEGIPPIRVGEMNGEVYTPDHRRLVAFREAGIPIQYHNVHMEDVMREVDQKMTTSDNGLTVKIRGGVKK